MKKIIMSLGFGLLTLATYAQSALDFEKDDVDYVEITNSYNSVLTGTNSLTIEGWINIESNAPLQTVIGDYGPADMNFLLRVDNGVPGFWVSTGGSFTLCQATTILPLATWTHIAGVWDGTNMKIYVNGVLENTISKGGVFDSSTYPVRVGAAVANESTDGLLDNVRVWSTARTDLEVNSNMNVCLSGSEVGLIALYDFEAGVGTVLSDITGNGYDGTFVNSPVWAAGFGCTNLGAECVNAIALAPLNSCGGSQTVTGSTVGGTPNAEPFCGTSIGTGGATWYTFLGDGSNMTVSTVNTGTNYDSKLWIYEGTCGALNCITGNDDFGSLQSQVTFLTTSGLTYYVVVGGFSSGEGNYNMTISNIDVQGPVPDVATLADLTDPCSVTATAPTATDNCTGVVTGTTPATFPMTSSGTITWTYNDGNGNSTTQEQVITIMDAIAPVADVTTLADLTDACSVTPTAPTATDNCSGAISGTTTTSFPITAQGTTIVTWSYEDDNGNSATQMQNVIITDAVAPIEDVATLSDLTDACSVTMPTPPTATDNCAGSIIGTTTTTFPMTGSGTITWTYDDGNGNVITQDQSVIITDAIAPVADVVNLADLTAECSVNPTPPTATDNCLGTINGITTTTFPMTASGTITWTYDDGNGNLATQDQTVTITDVTAPVPNAANVITTTAECQVISLSAPTATDNCVGIITGTTTVTFPITNLGLNIVTWTYDDGSGNITTQDQQVYITDSYSPVPDVTTLNDISETCQVTSLSTPTATDNCVSIITVTNNATLPITTIGTTVVTWTYDDGNGNTSTQTQNVIVLDPMIDVTTTTSNLIITANNAAATSYQWIDCNDLNTAINGETNASYSATADGDYAVIITEGDCSDTSNCVTIAGVGINEIANLNVSIYPNPNKGEFYISTLENDVTISIFTADGKIVLSNLQVTEGTQLINLEQVQSGIYFVKVSNDVNQRVVRLIIE